MTMLARTGDLLAWCANRVVAGVLLLLVSPLLVVLIVAIGFLDGWPPIYGGRRLGRNKRPFTMYKLRTLVRNADGIKGSRLVRSDDRLFIRGGRFLRDTRLDELPQLLNVLLGQMDFLGPRPERREVYEELCRDIPGYERRFDVRPGLVGPSQLFTPHCTDKRYRTLLDNHSMRRGGEGIASAGIVAYAGALVVKKSLRRGLKFAAKAFRDRVRGDRHWRRRFRRLRPAAVELRLGGDARGRFALRDVNDEALSFRSDAPLRREDLTTLELFIGIEPLRGGPRLRHARCVGELIDVRAGEDGTTYVVHYLPTDSRSEYVVSQYLLRSSLAYPRRRAPASEVPVHVTPRRDQPTERLRTGA